MFVSAIVVPSATDGNVSKPARCCQLPSADDGSGGGGALGENRTTYLYDDRDNPIEQVTEDQSREIGAADDGTVRTRNESVRRHAARFEYQYDSHGNWTERIVSSRLDPNPTFQRSNIERRQITYYAR